MTRLPYRAHGAARIAAGLGPAPDLPLELPEAVREQALRAELEEQDLQVAWEIARLPSELASSDRVGLAALVLLTIDALAQGSTRIAIRGGEIEERARALAMDAPLRSAIASIVANRASEPFRELFGEPGDARPLIVEGDHLYQQRLHELEVRLAAALRRRLETVRSVVPIELPESLGFRRSAEQDEAIQRALSLPLTLITGGPGTGKTSVVVSIVLAELARGELGPSSIALAAPTGKAADRLREAIERGGIEATLMRPRTLHRLLGFSPESGTFRHHAGNPLSERLVIVDESSMIDVYLMERLVQSLRSDARLVLLGDAEQLPSVAAGAVFRDLASAASVPSVRLSRSHRMNPDEPAGENILRVAAHINAGEMPACARAVIRQEMLLAGEPGAIGLIDALPLEGRLGGVLHAGGELEAFLDAWYERYVLPGRDRWEARYRAEGSRLVEPETVTPLFDLTERSRLLAITRSAARATGVEALAIALHQRHARALDRDPSDPRWLAGEPVLVHRNDYERGLFNGDQGLLLWVGSRLSAVFRRQGSFSEAVGLDRHAELPTRVGRSARPARQTQGSFLAHPLDLVRPVLSLGFATTVHKAQGSEHDTVGLVLPETDVPRLLTREIVYTALTRARRTVLVVGDLDLVARAASRRVSRSTGIGERLSTGHGGQSS